MRNVLSIIFYPVFLKEQKLEEKYNLNSTIVQLIHIAADHLMFVHVFQYLILDKGKLNAHFL